jgi:hypothetical protein
MRTTSNERRRIYRGFYRFEIFIQLLSRVDMDISRETRLSGFLFKGFEPWEVEEMICVRTYIYRFYCQISIEDIKMVRDLFFSQNADEISRNKGLEECILKLLVLSENIYRQCGRFEENISGNTDNLLARKLLGNGLMPLSKLLMENDRCKRGSKLFQHVMISEDVTNTSCWPLRRYEFTAETEKRLLGMRLADDNDSTSPNSAWLEFKPSTQGDAG